MDNLTNELLIQIMHQSPFSIFYTKSFFNIRKFSKINVVKNKKGTQYFKDGIQIKLNRSSAKYVNNAVDEDPLDFNKLITSMILTVVEPAYLEDYLPKFPPNLIKLQIRDFFHDKVDCLPSTLKYLSISGEFNRNVDNLPQNLIKLQLLGYFDKRIDNLPKSLTHLSLGRYFDKPINNLPKNLKVLVINHEEDEDYNFDHPIDKLPNLIKLKIYSSVHVNKLPESIECLHIDVINLTTPKIILPSSLEHWVLPSEFMVDGKETAVELDYPAGLTSLNKLYSGDFLCLTKTIRKLKMSATIDKAKVNLSSYELKDLDLKDCTNGNVIYILPKTLEKIIFSHDFDKKIIYPSSIKYIKFGKYFNQEFKIPLKLEHLYFPRKSHFNKKFKNIPSSLKTLHLGAQFSQNLDWIETNIIDLKCYHLVKSLPAKIVKAELMNLKQEFNFFIPKTLCILRTENKKVGLIAKYITIG